MTKRVCARQSRINNGAVRMVKGVWPFKGEPMTSRNEPPAHTGGPRDERSHAGQPDLSRQPPGASPRPDPAFAPQREVSARDYNRLSSSFPSPVPPTPPLHLTCLGTIGASDAVAARNLATLTQALGVLANSPTGQHLVNDLIAAGYSVVFDDARTVARGASGLCDPANKTIVLKSAEDRDTLALLLAHEAVHALQNARADDLLPSARHRPETIFRLAFAIEADAYAQQVQVAFELSRLHSIQRPLLLMRSRFPGLVRAGDRVLQDAADKDRDQGRGALGDGRLMAGLFSAFYDDFAMRSYYERVHLDFITAFADKRKLDQVKDNGATKDDFNTAASGLSDLFRRDMTSDRLKSLLHWRGQSYLKLHRADMDFASPRYAGLSAPTRTGVENFYKTYLPGRKAPQLSTFGLYVVSATKNLHPDKVEPPSVIKPGMNGNGTGSSIRAPRKRKRDFW